MSSEIAIKVDGLGKCYQIYDTPRDRLMQIITRSKRQYFREFWALKNVSFEIKKGETIGVVGRNGSGKSTLLQILCGTLNQTTGSIRTNGRIAALLELGSGFNPEFTGRENVYLNGTIHGLKSHEIDDVFDDIAGFADIGTFLDQPVKTYSSGMYARLAFAASIFINPDIFVVDEILAVGDAPFQAKCMRAFHKLRERGTAILLVSHDTYTIRNFCNRALYLRNGDFVAFDSSAKIIEQYTQEVEIAFSKTARNKRYEDEVEGAPKTRHTPKKEEMGLFMISNVRLIGPENESCNIVNTGDLIRIEFDYTTNSVEPPLVTFVINLYRHDGLYVFGTTTLMDGISAISPGCGGTVSIEFPNLRLLAGQYVWRVAINDEQAFGVYVEASQVCHFKVEDTLQAVGLFNVERRWGYKTVAQEEIKWSV